jgi:hypothetical protein
MEHSNKLGHHGIPEALTAGIVQILRNDGIVVGTGFLVSKSVS